MLALSDLAPGESAQIVGYKKDCSMAYRSQLLAMGLTPKAVVRVIRRAPMGDPVLIQVREATLSLRQHEARVLQLQRVDVDE